MFAGPSSTERRARSSRRSRPCSRFTSGTRRRPPGWRSSVTSSPAWRQRERRPVLVVGATGALGFQVCEALAAAGRRVRALTRPTANPARVALLRSIDAEVVEGDLERPGTLRAALDGVASVVTTASAFPRDPRRDAIELVD